MPRKITQDIEYSRPLPSELPLRERLVVGVTDDGNWLTVACQDGAVFRRGYDGDWTEIAPIPQTPRWYQVTGAQMDAAG